MRTVTIAILIFFCGLTAHATNYYVSTSGSDSNPGTISQPWATIAKVNSATYAAGDYVLFSRGQTFTGQILPQRSTLNYGAYGTGSKPIVSGFQTLTGWTLHSAGIYRAATTALNTANMVVVDGVNKPKGRYPNSDFLRFESHSGLTSITDNALTSSPVWTGADVCIKTSRYTLEQRTISSHSGSTLTFSAVQHELQDGYGYFFQNSVSVLDQYGEWFISGGFLYMYFGAVNPATTVVKVGIYDDVFKVQNRTDITISDLTIEGGNNSCIYANVNCTNIEISGCELRFSGNYGTTSVASGYTVTNCNIHDCNNFGIYSYAPNALFSGNTINKIGEFPGMGGYTGYMGIAANGDNSVTEYNVITNIGYNGIILRGNNSIVRYNFIDTFCVLLDDGGGIYSSNNTYTGRIIDHNICINGIGNFAGATNYSNTLPSTTLYAHGIYLDEMAADITVSNNVTAHNSDSGIFLHSATNIDVTANVSYNNAKNQLLFSHNTVADNMANIHVTNNIFIAKESVQKCFQFTSNYNDLAFGSASGNVYARPLDDTETFSIDTYNTSATAYDLAAWKTLSGYDANSTKSPKAITTTADFIFDYNASAAPKVVSFDGTYLDARNVPYIGSITLQPYTAAVLIKTENTNPEVLQTPVLLPGNQILIVDGKFLVIE